MHRFVFMLAACLWALPVPAAVKLSSTACTSEAIAQAKKLLAFHSGNDDRAEVDDKARPLPSIANPGNPKQRFDVLEVWGYIYKGQYRMRFEYYRMDSSCVLMGQEILERASL